MVKSLLVKVVTFVIVAIVGYVFQELASPKRSGSDLDHHTKQKNPNNPANAAARNNRANQMNPNNPAYSKSRANNQS
ncbi:MAG: hypothetical protein F4Z82_16735 [Caldilineaceae bacterium SB0668_bin_21]|nr:hypothetical protein [Caldilineaceae bacterium SB0668_bin_21]